MLAAKKQHGSAGRTFARVTVAAPLNKSDIGAAGEKAIIEQAKHLEKISGYPVGLIILDTMAGAIAGDDENSAQDVTAYVNRKKRIASATGAAVLSVHHSGKDDARGMRGSSALFAACDVVMKVTSSGGVRHLEAEKVKDGEPGPLCSYQLKKVVLGTDDDGDEITSCIVQQVDCDISRRGPKRPAPHTADGKALNELEHLVIAGRGTLSRGHDRIPDGAMLVKRKDWQAACLAKGLSNGDQENETRTFRRAASQLEERFVGTYGEVVWLIQGRTNRTSTVYGSFSQADNPGQLLHGAHNGEKPQ